MIHVIKLFYVYKLSTSLQHFQCILEKKKQPKIRSFLKTNSFWLPYQ